MTSWQIASRLNHLQVECTYSQIFSIHNRNVPSISFIMKTISTYIHTWVCPANIYRHMIGERGWSFPKFECPTTPHPMLCTHLILAHAVLLPGGRSRPLRFTLFPMQYSVIKMANNYFVPWGNRSDSDVFFGRWIQICLKNFCITHTFRVASDNVKAQAYISW